MEAPLQGVVMAKSELDPKIKGINKTWRATVRTTYGDMGAIIKEISHREIIVECIAAMVAIELGLPTPRPMVVMDEGTAYYGSEEMPHPDLKHALIDLSDLNDQLLEWSHLHTAAVFDTWIHNSDRHGGNMLTDGLGGFWLIDHGLAIPEGTPLVNVNQNNLMDIVRSKMTNDISFRKNKNQLDDSIANIPKAICGRIVLLANWVGPDVLRFVLLREPHLPKIVQEQVSKHHDLLG